jgi:hypothetical protein
LAVPWKDILTSVPFWALTFTHTLNNFGWYMLLVELPMFMSTGLGFNIKEVIENNNNMNILLLITDFNYSKSRLK